MKEIPDKIFEKFSLRMKNILSVLDKEKKILVAVSGGPDSMFLLYLIYKYSLKSNIKIIPVYINHNVRKKSEIKKDIETIDILCKKLDLDLIIDEIKTKKVDENTLRELRYKKLYEIAFKYNSNTIATGHTKNDVVETFIFNLCRGSGLKGLCGIPFIREVNFKSKKIYIVRPIIDITKNEIIDVLNQLRIGYVVDRTNLDTTYKRNLIRNEVIPLLKKVNNNCEENIAFTSELISNVYTSFEEKISQCLKQTTKFAIYGVSIDLKKFLIYNDFTQREILYRVINQISIKNKLNTKQGYKVLVEKIEDFIKSKKTYLPLLKKVNLVKTKNFLRIEVK